MRIALLVFAVSIGSVVFWPALPDRLVLAVMVVCACFILFVLRIVKLPFVFSQVILAMVLGLGVAAWHGHALMASQLSSLCTDQTFLVKGQVIGLPRADILHQLPHVKFIFRLDGILPTESTDCKVDRRMVGHAILLNWYAVPDTVAPGQYWQFSTKLKRPRGQVNPYAADYQLWLLRKGFVATGTVFNGELLATAHWHIDKVRFEWRETLRKQVSSLQNIGLLAALTIGDSSLIPTDTRQLLQSTGTSHLMAISGLHIGLLGFFGYFLGRLLGVVVVLMVPAWIKQRLNANVFGAAGSIFFCFSYSALSGFSLPTQRALIMVLLFHIARYTARHWSLLDVWLMSLVLVLLMNPLQVSDAGFFLSFGAVFVLIFTLSARTLVGVTWRQKSLRWLLPQWWVFVGLTPLSVFVFSGISLVGVVANCIAIPWVSLTTVPLALLSFCFSGDEFGIATFLLFFAGYSANLLMDVLRFLSDGAGQYGWLDTGAQGSLILILAPMTLLMLLPMPARIKGCVMGVILFEAVALWYAPAINGDRERRVTVFDVGQGLAVLVEVDKQVLLYDTGPHFGVSSSAFDKVVLPYLQRRGQSLLDILVVSHNDDDHAGGLADALSSVEIGRLFSGEVLPIPRSKSDVAVGSEICHSASRAMPFGTDGHFYFDGRGAAAAGNNASCVMHLVFPEVDFILPGDIDKLRELALAPPRHNQAAQHFLIAPHHGSKSSSSYALLRQVLAGSVIVSAGYHSRYGHPHPEVVARYQELGLALLNTAESGAIQLRWWPGESVRLYRWRETEKHFWFDG